MTDFNNMFNTSYLVIENQLNKYGNTIKNYDVTYRITENNTIKIKLKNYYEKMFFIARLNNNNKKLVEVFSADNNYINAEYMK